MKITYSKGRVSRPLPGKGPCLRSTWRWQGGGTAQWTEWEVQTVGEGRQDEGVGALTPGLAMLPLIS